MKYLLKKDNLPIFETEYAVMADRKMAQGWELVTSAEIRNKEKINLDNQSGFFDLSLVKKRGRPKKVING